MGSSKSAKWALLIFIVLLAISQEGECRRKILRGRKAITRTYYVSSAVPGWAIVLLVGLGELVFGGLLFIILKFLCLDRAEKPHYIKTLVSSPRGTP